MNLQVKDGKLVIENDGVRIEIDHAELHRKVKIALEKSKVKPPSKPKVNLVKGLIKGKYVK